MKNQNDNFSEGSWVFYNNPNHHFHMMMFQIQKILPATMNQRGGYQLVYGQRSVEATADEMVPKGHPSLANLVLSSPYIPENQAVVLDPYGHVAAHITNIGNAHEGHDVVENYAGGKSFQYCRNCKDEVK
jgi:hypothetical protein